MRAVTWQRIRAADARLRAGMRERGPTILRVALGLVFAWFGALKIVGRSPVSELVAETIRFLPADTALLALGIVEVAVGIGLLTGLALRGVLAIFWVQLAGTFLVFVLAPSIAFESGNPLLLTTEGEFVVKNVVLIAAGLVVGGHARRLRAAPPLGAEQRRVGGRAS